MAERDLIEQLQNALESSARPPDLQIRELRSVALRLGGMPREDFRQRLRNQLKEQAMATATVNPIREGFPTLTPYFVVTDAVRFIDFLKAAFGAEEKMRAAGPDGRIMHAEMKIGDSPVELGQGNEQFPSRPASIHLYVPDTDAAYQQALAAGATSIHGVQEMPYGERSGGVTDPFGNNWYIATQHGPSHIPAGLRTVNAYLHPIGTAELIEFLKRAFGAEEVEVHREPADGPIVHAKIRIGDSILEMGEAHGQFQPMPIGLHMYVPNVDELYRRALEAGATSIFPVTDQPYGERSGGVKDPAGNQWFIATMLPVRK
jgi:PhnB protein